MSSGKKTKKIHVAIGCIYRPALVSQEAPQGNRQDSRYQILLGKRREQQLPELDNMWELPGGKVEKNEKPEDTVIREVFEETGYEIKIVSPLERIFTFIREYPDFTQHTYLTCLMGELVSDKQHPREHDPKIGEIKWFDPNEIEYKHTLVGSREFIVDVSVALGIKVKPDVQKTTFLAKFEVPVTKELRKTNEKRRGRKYVLILQFDPLSLNQYIIMAHSSGINRRGPDKIFVFDDYDSMAERAKKIISTRFTHQYDLIWWDEGFPLLPWMKKRKNFQVSSETSNQTPGIQLSLPLFEK